MFGLSQIFFTYIYGCLFFVSMVIFRFLVSGTQDSISEFDIRFAIWLPFFLMLVSGYFIVAPVLFILIRSRAWYASSIVGACVILFFAFVPWLFGGSPALTIDDLTLVLGGLICGTAAGATTQWIWSLFSKRSDPV